MNKDKITNLILFVIGIGLVAYSFAIKTAVAWGLSPSLFLLVCGGGLVLCSLFLKDKQKEKEQIQLKQLMCYFAVVFSYILLLGKLHFAILTAIFLFLLCMVNGRKNVMDSLIYSLGVSFFVYVVFSYAFSVNLP